MGLLAGSDDTGVAGLLVCCAGGVGFTGCSEDVESDGAFDGED